MAGVAFDSQVSEDLAYHAAELEAVPRETAGDGDLRMLGVSGDHEVLVRGVRVHARPGVEAASREGGDVLCQVTSDEVDLLVVHLAVYRVGVGGDAAGPEEGDFDPAIDRPGPGSRRTCCRLQAPR